MNTCQNENTTLSLLSSILRGGDCSWKSDGDGWTQNRPEHSEIFRRTKRKARFQITSHCSRFLGRLDNKTEQVGRWMESFLRILAEFKLCSLALFVPLDLVFWCIWDISPHPRKKYEEKRLQGMGGHGRYFKCVSTTENGANAARVVVLTSGE